MTLLMRFETYSICSSSAESGLPAASYFCFGHFPSPTEDEDDASELDGDYPLEGGSFDSSHLGPCSARNLIACASAFCIFLTSPAICFCTFFMPTAAATAADCASPEGVLFAGSWLAEWG